MCRLPSSAQASSRTWTRWGPGQAMSCWSQPAAATMTSGRASESSGHGGEVEHEAGAVPAQRDGGRAVEHAAQRPGQQLVERVARPAPARRRARPAVRRSRAAIAVGRVGDEQRGDVDAGSARRGAGAGEVFDGGEDDGVLELGERAFEDGGDERGAHLGPAEDLAFLGFVARRPGPGRAG